MLGQNAMRYLSCTLRLLNQSLDCFDNKVYRFVPHAPGLRTAPGIDQRYTSIIALLLVMLMLQCRF